MEDLCKAANMHLSDEDVVDVVVDGVVDEGVAMHPSRMKKMVKKMIVLLKKHQYQLLQEEEEEEGVVVVEATIEAEEDVEATMLDAGMTMRMKEKKSTGDDHGPFVETGNQLLVLEMTFLLLACCMEAHILAWAGSLVACTGLAQCSYHGL
jgi:hypothetical protein